MHNPLRVDLGGVAAYLAEGGMCSAPEAMQLTVRDALLLSVRLRKRYQDEAAAHERAMARARAASRRR